MQLDRRTFLGLTSLVPLAAGCRLQRISLPEHTYVLQLPTPETSSGSATIPGALLVRPFSVSAPYSSRAFVIRRGESEFVVDAYNAFLMSPGTLLTEAFARWLRGVSGFEVVTTGGSQAQVTHALEGEISELYGDYRDPQRAQAHVALHLRLFHPLNGRSPTIRWQRKFRRVVDLPQRGADELVAGWNQALGEICREIEPELTQLLGNR